jgi:hypothetical protein
MLGLGANVTMRRIFRAFVLSLVAFSAGHAEGVTAEDGECSNAETAIATDRPDVTNSSVVVPGGSVQVEYGIDWTSRQSASVIDGPNTRIRLGIAHCVEVLFDLPNYSRPSGRLASAGFSDLSPAIKRQLGRLPGDIELSATVGLELPTGTSRIAGSGYGAYAQFPWSKEIGEGWSLSGMVTAFLNPGESAHNPTLEPTFAVERQVGSRTDVFMEYVADHARRGPFSQLVDAGGAYRITPTQQIDLHAGVGLNRAAPNYFFGIGYSFRFDHVL